MNPRVDPRLAQAARDATDAVARVAGWLGLGRGPSRPFWGVPRTFVVFLIVFAAGMLLISLVGDQGLVSYWMLTSERDQLRAEVTRLEARHAELQRVIHALRSDPEYIEQLARRDLGLVRPDEVIVQLPPREPSP